MVKKPLICRLPYEFKARATQAVSDDQSLYRNPLVQEYFRDSFAQFGRRNAIGRLKDEEHTATGTGHLGHMSREVSDGHPLNDRVDGEHTTRHDQCGREQS